jgi:4-carboxymuconolactone decarboxylase
MNSIAPEGESMMTNDPFLEIPLRTSDDTTGDVQRVLAKLESRGQCLKVHRILANSSATFRPFILLLSSLLLDSSLPADDREVVILHLAARRGVKYEWDEHVPVSAKAGISDAHREALSDGTLNHLDGFSESQRLALEIAEVIVTDGGVAKDLWTTAKRTWGEEGALDLILSVAFWGGYMPTVIQAIGLISVE